MEMASNSFKIKNSLVLTPKDLTTLTSPEAGDLACDINDSNKIKRYDASTSSWVEVGSGGVGGVDIMFVQDFESAGLSSFTQTGLSLSQTDPLRGRVSAVLTHQAAINQSFKQTVSVDRKFRGQTMTLTLDSKSSASQGNLVITVRDETNAVNLIASEQLQLANDVNGKKTTVGFTIPETCASLSYTITALPEAGSPVSRIDDIICQLAETALLETAVVVPNVTAWQGYTPTFQGFGTPSAVEFEYRQVGENVEIRGKFASGVSTSVEARIGLPGGLTSASTALIPSLQIVGKAGLSVISAADYVMLAEPSVSYLTIGRQGGTVAALSKILANVIATGETLSFFASVPCAGLSATSTKTIPLTQSGLVQEGDSAFRIDGALGYGSTGTTTLRFNTANIRESRGSDISYVSSSVNGDSFVVTSSGVFSISADAVLAGGATTLGITRNSSSTSTSVTTIATNNPQQVLTFSNDIDTNYSNVENVSWSGYLEAGDIIRVQTSGSAIGSAALFRFSMSKQGSLKQVSVSSDQKITIPTSELRMEGASARGTSPGNAIVKFDSVAKLRGDAFTVNNDPVLGTSITMKKAGKLDVSCTLNSSSGLYNFITINQQVLTGQGDTAERLVGFSSEGAADNVASGSCSVNVKVGDVIRVVSTANPSGGSGANYINLYFQEQEIQVSVSNTLPQFSESDSSVRVDTANGYGSTATRIRRFSNVRDNIGTDIEYLDSATNGASFVVKSAGIYNISYNDSFISPTYLGITKNVSSLSTSVNSITTSERLALEYADSGTGSYNISWQGYLQAGDVIRPHTDGASASTGQISFTISKVGKPNVTGVDVTPFVNVPQQDVQSTEIISASSIGTLSKVTTALTAQNNSGVFRYLNGDYTILKPCTFTIAASFSTAGAYVQIARDGVALAFDRAPTNEGATASVTVNATVGQVFSVTNGTSVAATGAHRVFVSATAASDSIIAPNESFSTDTASLQYAPSSSYTLSTLQNAPVGTYITFTYAANTNTRTQTTTPPSQSPADMNVNGMQIFTRAFNQTSSAASPAAIAIQIGKGLKGKSLDLYKSAGKVTAGSLDYISFGITDAQGVRYKDYNEQTGILLIDAATQGTSNTSASFTFSDITSQSSGYLVINASKSPALTGVPQLLPRIATLSDVKASGTSGGTATSGSYQTRTLNTLSDPTGIVTSLASNQFTLPAGEYYIEASAPSFNCEMNKIRIQNTTDSTTPLLGVPSYSRVTTNASTPAFLSGSIVITSTKTFELQHRVGSTQATTGFGLAASFGDNEVYAIVKITKVK